MPIWNPSAITNFYRQSAVRIWCLPEWKSDLACSRAGVRDRPLVQQLLAEPPVFSSVLRAAFELSSAHQWSFNIQRQFGADWLFEAGYPGLRGLHLVRQCEGKHSVPVLGGISTKRPYNSLAIPGTSYITTPPEMS